MRRLLLMMSVSLLLLIATACGSKEEVNGNGEGPADIPIQWVNAMIQRDDATRVKLLLDSTKALDPEKGPENEMTVKDYQLTEWKASDEKYFYEIKFIDPVSEDGRTEQMEIVKTDSGWKRTKFLNLTNFDSIVQGLDPKVIKEIHEE